MQKIYLVADKTCSRVFHDRDRFCFRGWIHEGIRRGWYPGEQGPAVRSIDYEVAKPIEILGETHELCPAGLNNLLVEMWMQEAGLPKIHGDPVKDFARQNPISREKFLELYRDLYAKHFGAKVEFRESIEAIEEEVGVLVTA